MCKVQRVAIKFKKCTYKFKYVLYVMEMLTKAWKSTPKKKFNFYYMNHVWIYGTSDW